MSSEKLILASIASAISGAVIGLLFAPDKGSKTRQLIAEEGDNYLQQLKENIGEARTEIDKRTKSTREEMDRIQKDAQNKSKGFVKKAKKMTSYSEWTKEELYEEAKRKEIKNYSTMNKSALINALRNR